jgi:hypothetical protein
MNNLLQKYHNWLLEIPESIGEIIACVVYLAFMISLVGGTVALNYQEYMSMYFCYGTAAIIFGLIQVA